LTKIIDQPDLLLFAILLKAGGYELRAIIAKHNNP